MNFDVYFGASPSTMQFEGRYDSKSYSPQFPLKPNTAYFWRIDSRYPDGTLIPGEVWTFRTSDSFAPAPPGGFNVPDGQVGVPVNVVLTWTGDGDTYDIAFWDESGPLATQSRTGYSLTTYAPAGLANSKKYFWQVTAVGSNGTRTKGPLLSFTTASQSVPGMPALVAPLDGATGQSLSPTLSWTCLGAVDYDIEFGTASTFQQVKQHHGLDKFSPGTLNPSTTYYWRITARNSAGGTTRGPLWSFTTGAASAPVAPGGFNVPDGQVGVPVNVVLTWTGDGDTYDIAFWDESGPLATQSRTGYSLTTYAPAGLANSKKYFWQVTAVGSNGTRTKGPLLSFTTASQSVPGMPALVAPLDGATGQSLSPTLSWTCLGAVDYDIEFGTASTFQQVKQHHGLDKFSPGTLNPSTTYYWRITARNSAGGTTRGPLWSFTTGAASAPVAPGGFNVPDGQVGVPVNVVLTWTGDGDTYDIAFWDESGPLATQSRTGYSLTTYAPAGLANSKKYFWQVTAVGSNGTRTKGPLLSFTTASQSVPGMPALVAPLDGATGQSLSPTLSWTCLGAVDYDIEFGTASTFQQVKQHHGLDKFSPGTLNPSTTYYWRITARNSAGGTTRGPLWSFTTGAASAPVAPGGFNVPDGQVGVPVNVVLTWTGDGDTYDIAFWDESGPLATQSRTGYSLTTYAPAGLANSKKYFWQVTAVGSNGTRTKGPLLSFTTASQSVPGMPALVAPLDGATGQSLSPTLSWTCLGAVDYDIEFGTASTFQQVKQHHGLDKFSPGTLNPSTTYYWRITARNSAGGTTRGPLWSFTTGAASAPVAPGGFNVPDGQVGVPVNVVLTWTGDGDTYDIAFWDESGPLATQSRTGYSLTTYAPAGLANSKKYFWQVTAVGSNGTRTKGPLLSFTTASQSVPGMPALVAPLDGATGQSLSPTLSWTCLGAVDYDIEFGTASTFQQVKQHHGLDKFSPGTLNPSTTYYWRITARNSAGGTTRGTSWNFTTEGALPTPTTAPTPTVSPTSIPTPTSDPLEWSGGGGGCSSLGALSPGMGILLGACLVLSTLGRRR